MALSPLLTPRKLAEALNVSARTLERWRLEGIGPVYVKVGRKVVYRDEDVEAWLAWSSRHSTSQVSSAVAAVTQPVASNRQVRHAR